MKEQYVKPALVSMEYVRNAAPVVGFLAAYAAARAVTNAIKARPVTKLPHINNK